VTFNTEVADGSIIGQIVDDGTATFDRTTDSLQAIADDDGPTADEIADAVWEEDASDHQTQGSFGQAIGDPGLDTSTIWGLANANLDTTVGSRSAPGDAMDLVTDAVDANAVAVSGANEIRDTILSDSTPFAGANIDAAVTSRAAPGDDMAIGAGGITAASYAADAITAAALATDAVNEMADAVLSRPLSAVETAAFRSLAGAVAKLVNKIQTTGTTLSIFKTDDATVWGTQGVTTDSGADPITGLDTN